MKNQRIRQAYDTINPTAEQKDRMLRSILQEADFPEEPVRQPKSRKKEPVVYRARPTKTNKKSAFMAIAASLAMVAVSAAVLVQMIRQPDGPAYVAPAETTLPTENTTPERVLPAEPTHYGMYNVIIADYVGYLNGTLQNPTGIPKKLLDFMDIRDTSGLGWIVYDVNEDGIEDLLIGDGELIYQAMTMDEDRGGLPILFTTMQQEQYYRCQDGVFCKISDYGSDYIQYDFFKVGKTYPEVQEILEVVICEKGEYRIGKTEEKAVPVDEATGQWTIGEKYLRERLYVTPFLEEKGTGNAENLTGIAAYDEIIQRYDRAVDQGWDAVNLEINNMSTMIIEDNAFLDLGWCTLDIDSNGQEELLIGTTDRIYDLYTILPEGMKQVAVSRAGNYHALCQNGYLVMTQIKGDDLPWFKSYFKYENGRIIEEEGISYVEVDSPSGNYWQYYRGASTSSQLRQPISKDEAGQIMSDYIELELFVTRFASAEEEKTQPARNLTGVAPYDAILETYYQAVEESWDEARLSLNGLPGEIAEKRAYGVLGWCTLDIDSNGQEELLISDGEKIYDSYTITARGELAPLMSASFEKTLALCQNGIFRAVYPNEGRTVYIYYKVTDEFTTPEKTIVYENGEYRAGQTEELAQPISKDEAGRIMSEYIDQELFVTRFMPRDPDAYDTEATYAETLQLYRQALTGKWNPGQCAEKGISMMIGYYADRPGEVGYAFLNLDGGEEELLITDGRNILDLYTVTDGAVRQVLSGYERRSYTLVDNNWIFCQGAGSAAVSCFTLYQMVHPNVAEQSGLVVREAYIFDAMADPVNPWFHSPDGENPGEPCGSFDAEARTEELMASSQTINFRRFN